MTNLLLILSHGYLSSDLKNIHMCHNSPNLYITWPSKATPLFRFKNGGMEFFLPSVNIYQQTRSGRHTNISKQKITTCLPLSSHQKYILNSLQQNKIMKNDQDHSEFTLLKMTLFPHQKHQNHMSTSFHSWMTTMALTLLLLLYFHESPTRSTWTQISRPCDLPLPCWSRNSPSITPQSSSGQKLNFPIPR